MTTRDRWLLPDGIEELLPKQARQAEMIRRQVLDLFESWGYQLVMPPLVEFADSLLVGVGQDLADHSFRLTDQVSGKLLAIRPDITAQVARIDAHSMQTTGLNRLCYAGSVLHAQPKSLTASRCPILAGAELYGDDSLDADIEVVSLMLNVLESVCNPGENCRAKDEPSHRLTLDVGHVGIYRAIEAELRLRCPNISRDGLAQIFEAVQLKSVPDLKLLLPELVDDQKMADLLLALPGLCGDIGVVARARNLLSEISENITAAFDQLETVADIVATRFPQVNVYLDLAELRGYDYHTGLVYAAYTDNFGSALANGGRYDKLSSAFGVSRAATGFNTDIKALIHLASTVDEQPTPVAAPHIAQMGLSSKDAESLWQKVIELRESGRVVVFVSPLQMAGYQHKLQLSEGLWQLVEQ